MEEQNIEPNSEPKKWKSWQVILIIIFLPFVLLYLATKFIWKRNWSIPIKLGATSFLLGIFFIAVISNTSSNKSEVLSATDTVVIIPTAQPTNIPVPTATSEPTTYYTPTPTPTYYPQKVYSLPTEIPTQKPIYIAPTNPPAQYFAPPVNQPVQNNSSNYNLGGSGSSGGSTGGSSGSTTNGSGGSSCNCSKTCTQISSCAEAQYLLNSCGCSARDGDHDGVACDGAPLHCQN